MRRDPVVFDASSTEQPSSTCVGSSELVACSCVYWCCDCQSANDSQNILVAKRWCKIYYTTVWNGYSSDIRKTRADGLVVCTCAKDVAYLCTYILFPKCALASVESTCISCNYCSARWMRVEMEEANCTTKRRWIQSTRLECVQCSWLQQQFIFIHSYFVSVFADKRIKLHSAIAIKWGFFYRYLNVLVRPLHNHIRRHFWRIEDAIVFSCSLSFHSWNDWFDSFALCSFQSWKNQGEKRL